MAKGKKKDADHRIGIKLPAHPHMPKEATIVPSPIKPETVKPLEKSVGPVRCIATAFSGWTENYIVLTAKEGSLPSISEDGTEVDVQFFAPLDSQPSPPHD